MQKPSAMLSKFVRTCFKLCQQQQQQQTLLSVRLQQQPACWLQVNHLRAAATCASPIVTVQSQQQQQQQQQWRRQQPLQSNSLAAPTPPTSSPTNQHILCSANTTPLLTALRPYSKFIAARSDSGVLGGGGSTLLTEERAHDLISNLKDSEREAIKTALAKYDATQLKETFEGKLAATQWRTRFGRLSKVPALGDVDPTGSFCAFPDDWLKKKAAEKAKEPTSQDLLKIFFVNAVPFLVFGFLDNFTMIVAGDYIEFAFGTFMCISTMAAAGLGNTISDILGIGSAFYVERGCEMLGLKPPDLTPIQMEMKSSRRSANYGRIIGITVGCLVGMFPLMFMDKKADCPDEQKPKK